ncbi:MAG: nucleotide exchange factor GrpE, partial [Clostridiales bacterium]
AASSQEEFTADEQEARKKFDAFMKDVAKLAEEKQEAEQRNQRLQADFDNFRRRKARESEEQIRNAAAALVTALLPILDNFERATAAMMPSSEKEGVVLIQKQLQTVLEQSGLKVIEAMGADFDPNFHEAVMQADAGAENRGKVTLEVQKGYLLNEKLLRPAMVQVGC